MDPHVVLYIFLLSPYSIKLNIKWPWCLHFLLIYFPVLIWLRTVLLDFLMYQHIKLIAFANEIF